MSDQVLRMRAEVEDRASGPLKRIQAMLASFKAPEGLKVVRDRFEGAHRSAERLSAMLKTTLNPAIAGLGITSLSLGGAFAAVEHSVHAFGESTVSLARMGKETGLTVDRLRQLEGLGSRLQITAEQTDSGIKTFYQSWEQIRRGTGEVYGQLNDQQSTKAFASELRGAKSFDEALSKAYGILTKIPNAYERAQVAQQLFGNSDFMRVGEMSLDKLHQTLGEIANNIGHVSEQGVAAAQRYENGIHALQEKLLGLRDKIGGNVLPAMNDLIAKADAFYEKNRGQIEGGIVGFITRVEGFDYEGTGTKISNLAGTADRLAGSIGGWGNALTAIGALLVAPRLIATASAIGTVALNVYKLNAALASFAFPNLAKFLGMLGVEGAASGAGLSVFAGIAALVKKSAEVQEPGKGGQWSAATAPTEDLDRERLADQTAEAERLRRQIAENEAMSKLPGSADPINEPLKSQLAEKENQIRELQRSLDALHPVVQPVAPPRVGDQPPANAPAIAPPAFHTPARPAVAPVRPEPPVFRTPPEPPVFHIPSAYDRETRARGVDDGHAARIARQLEEGLKRATPETVDFDRQRLTDQKAQAADLQSRIDTNKAKERLPGTSDVLNQPLRDQLAAKQNEIALLGARLAKLGKPADVPKPLEGGIISGQGSSRSDRIRALQDLQSNATREGTVEGLKRATPEAEKVTKGWFDWLWKSSFEGANSGGPPMGGMGGLMQAAYVTQGGGGGYGFGGGYGAPRGGFGGGVGSGGREPSGFDRAQAGAQRAARVFGGGHSGNAHGLGDGPVDKAVLTPEQPGDEHSKQTEVAAYIRARAASLNMDPKTAVAVAMSEGLRGWDGGKDGPRHQGDKGTSFGAYQLHYGGSGIPGMNAMGLGDDFTRQTGKDARDPRTWRSQVDFALHRAAKAGWTDWHGAANTGISKWQGIGTYREQPSGKEVASEDKSTGINPVLKQMIERTGEAMGAHLSVISGRRSEEDNRRAGGAENSLHLKGYAADLEAKGHPKSDRPFWERVNRSMSKVAEAMHQPHRWGGDFGGRYTNDSNHFDLTKGGPSADAVEKLKADREAASAARQATIDASRGHMQRMVPNQADAPDPTGHVHVYINDRMRQASVRTKLEGMFKTASVSRGRSMPVASETG